MKTSSQDALDRLRAHFPKGVKLPLISAVVRGHRLTRTYRQLDTTAPQPQILVEYVGGSGRREWIPVPEWDGEGRPTP